MKPKKNTSGAWSKTILKDGAPWDANMILDDGGDLTELLHKKYRRFWIASTA